MPRLTRAQTHEKHSESIDSDKMVIEPDGAGNHHSTEPSVVPPQAGPSSEPLQPSVHDSQGTTGLEMAANPSPQVSSVFDCSSFYDDFLLLSASFCSDSFNTDDYKIVEFALGSKDGSQMYSMTTRYGSLPVMKVVGEIEACYMIPELVHMTRIADRPLRMDKYLLRLCLSSKDYQTSLTNATKATELWQSQKDKLFDICRAAKLYSKKGQFEKQGVDIVFHGLMSPNEFVFTKNVASIRPVDSNHPLRSLLPNQAEKTFMRKPSSFEWNTKIPIFDESFKLIDLSETSVIEKQAEVYFQINQLFYGGKLRLNPEICAVKVTMSEILESPKKKARKSALF